MGGVRRPDRSRPIDTHLRRRLVAARRRPDRSVLEGFHAVKHALRFGAEIVDLVTPDPDALGALAEELAPDIAAELRGRARRVSTELWAEVTDGGLPSPALGVAVRPTVDVASLLAAAEPTPIVLLEDPTHLGNVGAVVRVCAAAGAAGVLTTGRADPWHPSAIRGAAGLHHAVPVARLDAPPVTDRPLVALHPDGEELTPETLPARAVLAFGTERHGLSGQLLDRAEHRSRIPMVAGVSSLNLATAVAVALFTTRPAWSVGSEDRSTDEAST